MSETASVVAVFGSSRARPGDGTYELAERVGRLIAERGKILLNGGYGGVMEASARAAKAAGGRTIGVTLALYRSRPNPWIDEEVPAETLCQRLEAMIARSGAFLVLPGGTGTLAEIGFIWEAIAKGLAPPRPFIFVGAFWRPLVELVGPESARSLVRVARDAEEAMRLIEA